LRGNDNAAGESDDDGDLFEDHDNASVSSKRSTRSNLTNPVLVRQEKKTTRRKGLADELTLDHHENPDGLPHCTLCA
jgi:hypothetical protein